MSDALPGDCAKARRTAAFLLEHEVAPPGVAESYAEFKGVQLLCDEDFEARLHANVSILVYWLEPEVLDGREIRTAAEAEAYLYVALDEMLSEWREGEWSEPMSSWLWFKHSMGSRPALTFDEFVAAVRRGVRESLRDHWGLSESAGIDEAREWALHLPRVHGHVVKAALSDIRPSAHFTRTHGGLDHALGLSPASHARHNQFSSSSLAEHLIASNSGFSLRKSAASISIEAPGEYIVSPSAMFRTIRGHSMASAVKLAGQDFDRLRAVTELIRAGLVADRSGSGPGRTVKLEPRSLRSIFLRALDCAILEQPNGSAWSRISAAIDFAIAAMFAADPGHRLIGAVTSLEALFLREREDVRRSLSERIAFFIESEDSNRAAAKRWIAELYRNRSDIVHGRRVPPSVRRWQLSQLLGGCIVQAIQFISLREATEGSPLTGRQLDESLQIGVRTRRRRSELLPLDIGHGLWKDQPHDEESFLDQRE